MKPVAPNTLIQNRYLIVHLIGKGGMGEVYLAVDQRLGSAVALKRTFFSEDATLGNAFEREAKTLARLRHPALPKVSDHFTEEGTQYLVMEHISGDDISKRLEATDKPFPLNWVLFWADQLLDALTYLHSHEPPIIHRDIKPQNLKLTDENHIVLLDFGLSKNSLGETRVTTTGSIVGYTPHYAPMEQIRGTGTDSRSDLYSLSATLYQIMTNVVPPDALTRADSLINGMLDPVKPISELNPEVSRAISDVVIKGMAISQEQRWKTAREMQKALRDAYSQLQSGMSANTVAFTTESQPEIAQSQQKTEQFSGVSSISPPAAVPAAPVNSGSLISQSKADVVNAQAITETGRNAERNFDATLRYDSDENAAKQSDIKTEVLLAGSTPAITAAQNGNFGRVEETVAPVEPETSGRTENFGQSDFFKFDENVETPKNFSPDATTPLISFDSQSRGTAQNQTATSFDSLSERGENRANDGATYIPTETAKPREETFKPAPVAPQKSSGKGLAIGGGIAALLLLIVAAAGIGWYLTRDGGTTENVTPTPTAFPTATIEPTVAPTVDIAGETNSSTNSETNSETNSDVVNTETNTSTDSNVTVGTQNTPNRQQQTQNTPPPIRTPTPQRQTQQTTTVRTPTARTPVPTNTPKRTKTDIEQ